MTMPNEQAIKAFAAKQSMSLEAAAKTIGDYRANPNDPQFANLRADAKLDLIMAAERPEDRSLQYQGVGGRWHPTGQTEENAKSAAAAGAILRTVSGKIPDLAVSKDTKPGQPAIDSFRRMVDPDNPTARPFGPQGEVGPGSSGQPPPPQPIVNQPKQFTPVHVATIGTGRTSDWITSDGKLDLYGAVKAGHTDIADFGGWQVTKADLDDAKALITKNKGVEASNADIEARNAELKRTHIDLGNNQWVSKEWLANAPAKYRQIGINQGYDVMNKAIEADNKEIAASKSAKEVVDRIATIIKAKEGDKYYLDALTKYGLDRSTLVKAGFDPVAVDKSIGKHRPPETVKPLIKATPSAATPPAPPSIGDKALAPFRALGEVERGLVAKAGPVIKQGAANIRSSGNKAIESGKSFIANIVLPDIKAAANSPIAKMISEDASGFISGVGEIREKVLSDVSTSAKPAASAALQGMVVLGELERTAVARIKKEATPVVKQVGDVVTPAAKAGIQGMQALGDFERQQIESISKEAREIIASVKKTNPKLAPIAAAGFIATTAPVSAPVAAAIFIIGGIYTAVELRRAGISEKALESAQAAMADFREATGRDPTPADVAVVNTNGTVTTLDQTLKIKATDTAKDIPSTIILVPPNMSKWTKSGELIPPNMSKYVESERLTPPPVSKVPMGEQMTPPDIRRLTSSAPDMPKTTEGDLTGAIGGVVRAQAVADRSRNQLQETTPGVDWDQALTDTQRELYKQGLSAEAALLSQQRQESQRSTRLLPSEHNYLDAQARLASQKAMQAYQEAQREEVVRRAWPETKRRWIAEMERVVALQVEKQGQKLSESSKHAVHNYAVSLWKLQEKMQVSEIQPATSPGLKQATLAATQAATLAVTSALSKGATQAQAKTAAQEAAFEALQEATKTGTKASTLSKTATRAMAKEAAQEAVLTATKTATATRTVTATREATKTAEATTEAEAEATAEATQILKLPKGKSDQESTDAARISKDGALTWKQGALRGKPMYKLWIYPYGKEDFRTVSEIPKGASMVTGSFSAYRTARVLRGKAPSEAKTADIGAFLATVTPADKAKTKIRLSFRPDPSNKPPSKVRILKRHDDGDLTVQKGKNRFVLTTEGQTFKEVKHRPIRIVPPRSPRLPRFDSDLHSLRRGKIFYTRTSGGTLLSRRPLGKRR